MVDREETTGETAAPSQTQANLFGDEFSLVVTLDVADGSIRFEWSRAGHSKPVASARLSPVDADPDNTAAPILRCVAQAMGKTYRDGCKASGTSARALVKRIRKFLPLPSGALKVGILTDKDLGMAKAGRWLPLHMPAGLDSWDWLGTQVTELAQVARLCSQRGLLASAGGGRTAVYLLCCSLLEVPPEVSHFARAPGRPDLLDLEVTFDTVKARTEFVWKKPGDAKPAAVGRVRCTGSDQLIWDLQTDAGREPATSSPSRRSIAAALERWLNRFPTNEATVAVFWNEVPPGSNRPERLQEPFGPEESPYLFIEASLVSMAEALKQQFLAVESAGNEIGGVVPGDFERYTRRQIRKQQKREEEELRRREWLARQAEERRKRELRREELRRAADPKKSREPATSRHVAATDAGRKERPPLPPVPITVEMPRLEFQDTAFPLTGLGTYFLRERAALWWVSNQSDDLLCLPHCRIQKLDYQIRTALRVLGPLRGRALLSDEVGLGKTIEAGLVIKELLTRGMVKRFLVLTVPSLVDQWEEELNDKFGLTVATTNQVSAREDAEAFWLKNPAIVASLHTLKQPAQVAVARQVQWDILVVDEAHYLRNRDSQAWQAVNSLPRQFLLLLTATPVQNSLEELYNLVTLLQPGQLPSPKEFRSRFVDPERPRQPREPEELRRLLGQVMIRNTRANAGVKLPPRRAETVIFAPGEAESEFWRLWESQLRGSLAKLPASQSSFWGRLLLQTAGSSPAAWRASLQKFPDASATHVWRAESSPDSTWRKKCDLLQPLTKVEGGAVIFAQFLETQAALAEHLRAAGVETFVINGSTPAAQRQPITEEFHKKGGALLLTHSGTEGRNLQFSHQLVNFDLPWNPMEIEQRIGRLHRLGQERPVRIYNFVQAGTLQEHLLELLQEKLNLFELVVGETGLVLGDRFSSEEFAEEIFRRWRESEGSVREALVSLGAELTAARESYDEVKKLDETLFAKDYESL